MLVVGVLLAHAASLAVSSLRELQSLLADGRRLVLEAAQVLIPPSKPDRRCPLARRLAPRHPFVCRRLLAQRWCGLHAGKTLGFQARDNQKKEMPKEGDQTT